MSTSSYRWRVTITPFEGADERGWLQRLLKPRKWHWKRDQSATGGWWSDGEGYAGTLDDAFKKATKEWQLYRRDATRLEVVYGVEYSRVYAPAPPADVKLEVLS